MPIIKILNRDYQIACGPGEEAKLFDLADKLDQRLKNNAKSFKGANDITLLLVTALMLEDSLQDIKNHKPDVQQDALGINETIEELAERINFLSKKLSN